MTRAVGSAFGWSGVGVRMTASGARVGGKKVAGKAVAAGKVGSSAWFELPTRHMSDCGAGITQRTRRRAEAPRMSFTPRRLISLTPMMKRAIKLRGRRRIQRMGGMMGRQWSPTSNIFLLGAATGVDNFHNWIDTI